jgi:hypothetical protein
MGFGTLANSTINRIRVSTKEYLELILDWTVQSGSAAGNGTVSLNLATQIMANHPKIFTKDYFGGALYAVETIAGASGDLTTNVATTMSITIKDPYGLDIAAGNLVNRSTTAAEIVYSDPPILLNSDLQLNVASTQAVGAKGRIIMWIQQ